MDSGTAILLVLIILFLYFIFIESAENKVTEKMSDIDQYGKPTYLDKRLSMLLY